MKTPLGKCADYHANQALVARELRKAAIKMRVGTALIDVEIAMHESFATACREADGDDNDGFSKLMEKLRV